MHSDEVPKIDTTKEYILDESSIYYKLVELVTTKKGVERYIEQLGPANPQIPWLQGVNSLFGAIKELLEKIRNEKICEISDSYVESITPKISLNLHEDNPTLLTDITSFTKYATMTRKYITPDFMRVSANWADIFRRNVANYPNMSAKWGEKIIQKLNEAKDRVIHDTQTINRMLEALRRDVQSAKRNSEQIRAAVQAIVDIVNNHQEDKKRDELTSKKATIKKHLITEDGLSNKIDEYKVNIHSLLKKLHSDFQDLPELIDNYLNTQPIHLYYKLIELKNDLQSRSTLISGVQSSNQLWIASWVRFYARNVVFYETAKIELSILNSIDMEKYSKALGTELSRNPLFTEPHRNLNMVIGRFGPLINDINQFATAVLFDYKKSFVDNIKPKYATEVIHFINAAETEIWNKKSSLDAAIAKHKPTIDLMKELTEEIRGLLAKLECIIATVIGQDRCATESESIRTKLYAAFVRMNSKVHHRGQWWADIKKAKDDIDPILLDVNSIHINLQQQLLDFCHNDGLTKCFGNDGCVVI